MNETNLTQRVKSTDINALKIFFSKGYEENFEKRGIYLERRPFIMIYVV